MIQSALSTNRSLLPVTLGATVLLTGSVGLVFVALSDIQTSLGFGPAAISWVVNAYLITYGGTLVVGGRLADMLGGRTCLLIGLGVFIAAATLGAAATGPLVVVLARGIQGLGAALATPAVFTVIGQSYKGAERVRVLSVFTAVTSLGFSLGLVGGGVITEWLGWRWTFGICVPLGAGLIAACVLVLPRSDRRSADISLIEAALSTVGTFAMVFGFIEAADRAYVLSVVGFGIAMVFLVALRLRLRAAADPLVPRELFTDHVRVGAFVATALAGGSVTGALLFLTRFYAEQLNFSPARIGAMFLLFTMPGLVSALSTNAAIVRFGVRAVAYGFGTTSIAGFTILASVGSIHHLTAWLFAGVVLIGFGCAATLVCASVLVLGTVRSAIVGVAGGMLQTAQQVGSAIGTAVLVLVYSIWSLPGVFAAGAVMVTSAALCFALPRWAAGPDVGAAQAGRVVQAGPVDNVA